MMMLLKLLCIDKFLSTDLTYEESCLFSGEDTALEETVKGSFLMQPFKILYIFIYSFSILAIMSMASFASSYQKKRQ